MRFLVAAVVLAAATLAGGGAPDAGSAATSCRLFPSSFSTNRRVDKLPVLAGSDAIVASIGLDRGIHPDFGSGTWEGSPIGIPFNRVSRATKRSHVGFDYADESDRVGYPIPGNVRI